MDVKNTHSVTKTEISVFGRQALDAERRRSPSLADKVLTASLLTKSSFPESHVGTSSESSRMWQGMISIHNYTTRAKNSFRLMGIYYDLSDCHQCRSYVLIYMNHIYDWPTFEIARHCSLLCPMFVTGNMSYRGL